MATILKTLRSRGPGGLPLRDARQLFLWLYAVVDVLPPEVRRQPPGREELVAIFSVLAADGVIAPDDFPDQPTGGRDPAEWDALIRNLLLKKVELDDAFFERARAYLRDVRLDDP